MHSIGSLPYHGSEHLANADPAMVGLAVFAAIIVYVGGIALLCIYGPKLAR